MITVKKNLTLDPRLLKPFILDHDLSNLMIIDIETTGFSADKCMIYLIGCIYYEDQGFKFIQWLCEKDEDEYEMLYHFSKFISKYHFALHYNGTSFDFPFIKRRLHLFGIKSSINDLIEIDLYARLRPYHDYLNLENLKLKTLEKHYGYARTDCFDGGTLIHTYQEYVKASTPTLEKDLLLHNEEDLIGLFQCLKVGDTLQFFEAAKNKSLSLTEMTYTLEDNILQMSIPYFAAFNSVLTLGSYQLEITPEFISIKIATIEDVLHFYFKDYRNYYYLPLEDQAVHKSIAQFVDSEHKIKANRENCYIKKRGTFIPLTKSFITLHPTFKYHQKDTQHYVELSEQLLNEKAFFSQLFLHILSTL